METVFNALKKEFPLMQRDVLLKGYGTFNIGGSAEYFLIAETEDEVLRGVALAKKMDMPCFIFGGGSNLLISDKGLKGLVIKMSHQQPKVDGFSVSVPAVEASKNIHLKNETIIEAYGGVGMDELVSFSIHKSLKGIEWAGGLPGSFGGAIRGNAGAFGGEIKDSIFQVKALDDQLEPRTFSNAECKFSYRNSIFKEKNWIILSAQLQLVPASKEELAAIAQSRIQYRKDKHPLEYPNVGSIFKGVAFDDIPDQFKKIFEDKVKNDPFPLVPAAWFIIEAGLAGTTISKAQFSKKHANYIINLGGATSDDVLKLIKLAQKTVKEKFAVDLEIEVQYIE